MCTEQSYDNLSQLKGPGPSNTQGLQGLKPTTRPDPFEDVIWYRIPTRREDLDKLVDVISEFLIFKFFNYLVSPIW